MAFNPKVKLDPSQVEVAPRGDANEKFAPEYLSDPTQVKAKQIHGPRFIPTSDPNWNDDQKRQYQEMKHPDIKPAKPGRGNHSVKLGG